LKLATLWFESSDLRNAVESVWTALLQQSTNSSASDYVSVTN
jgi:hypothetical protein